MDYTPGIFVTDIGKIVPWGGKMNITICNQLGLYVTFYSPLQMAADFPEHYAQFMDAFQFIKDVAVDWDKSIYLEAEPGAYIVTARHPKISTLNTGVINSVTRFVYNLPDNATIDDLKNAQPHDVWYVGGVTDENAREVKVKLDFLEKGKKYEATIYADAPDACGLASGDYNPQAYTITNKKVTSKSVLKMKMAPCGGFAISIREY